MSALFVFLFIVAILFSIGLHEFGHLITAKWAGMKVQQYFIGFGPKIWSTYRGETEYGVKALPFGGFVRIAGMNPFEEVPPEDRDRVYKAKKPWKRAIVLASGSFTHFLLGLVILMFLLMIVGEPTDFQTKPIVAGVEPGSAAAEAGLEVDDEILAIDGVPVRGEWSRAVEVIKERPGEEITITVRRDAKRLELGPATLASSHPDEPDVRSGYLGVGPLAIAQDTKHYGPIDAVTTGGSRVGNLMWNSLLGLKTIVDPSTLGRLFEVAAGRTERTFNDPASLYGVGQIAGQLGSDRNFAALFELIVVFNVFIGVANLLPLPPLDGGHLAVLGYEKLARHDVDMRKLIPITTAVILFFGTLFMLLLYLDIARPLPALPG